MDTAELQARADANYLEALRSVARYAPDGEIRERDGVLIAATGAPVAMFNPAIVTRPLANPAAQLAEVADYFDARGLPFVVRIREGLDPRAEAAAEALGLPYSDSVPNLALEDPSARGSWYEGLDIRTATQPATLEDHAHVCAQAFDVSIEVARVIAQPGMLTVPDIEIYVGYHEGRPIASSALILTNRVAGIFNVGTPAEFRRRGLGEAMTWHAVRRGAERGALFANLQASDMGRPIYERMGFRLTTVYRTFHRPGV